MTDSPAFRFPLDPVEQPILDSLLVIRDRLLLLKQDKTRYVKSQDVVTYYNQLIAQVDALNDIRKTKRGEQNRLDTVLDDCFSLVSLFFLTIGRNNEAPAAYSVSSTIKRLLDHLKEAGFFTGKDLTGIEHNLTKVKAIVEQRRNKENDQILLLLDARIQNCQTTLGELKLTISQLSPDLTPIHEKLVSILRSLSGLNTRAKFPVDEVGDFQAQLLKIEEELGESPPADGSPDEPIETRYIQRLKEIQYGEHAVHTGREVVLDLLGRCQLWAQIVLSRNGKIDERFKDQYDHLSGVRTALEKLSLTQAWSLRETDLYGYQRKLDRADESRIDGFFVDSKGEQAALYEQRTLLYLLRKSYSMIYYMITSSEPVSEALLPIYNQLLTLRKCLVEVKRSGGVSSPRELYPYSMKLNSIDNMRQDGKFIVNGDIPEGQGSVTALLSECFEMAYELRNEAAAKESDSDEDEADEADEQSDRVAQTSSSTHPAAESIGVK